MERVTVTRTFHGFCAMQVCAVKDATDKEIFAVCNKQNPSGTRGGWRTVVRTMKDLAIEKSLPMICDDDNERLHFIVLC